MKTSKGYIFSVFEVIGRTVIVSANWLFLLLDIIFNTGIQKSL
jgi:hypothetical protein